MPTLDWIGKKAVVNHHREVPYRLIHCDGEKSAGDPDAGNLLVQGDNLEALKALLPYYAGKVKCIYIDPPYNTGNEGWVYNDNVNSPEIKQWLGSVVGKEAEDLSRHDKWLCMMYPRLKLLREFLREDGVMLVSIGADALAYLLQILYELFGKKNVLCELIWEKIRKNDAKKFSVGHEYMVVVSRNHAVIEDQRWRSLKEGVGDIARRYEALVDEFGDDWGQVSKGLAQFYRELPSGHPSKKYSRAKNGDQYGVWRDNNISWHGGGGPRYDLIHPVTGLPCKVPDAGWRFVEDSMREKIRDGYVIFREDHTEPPIYKTYVYRRDGDGMDGQKEVLPSVFYRHSQPANDQQRDIFGKLVFENPKDQEIISRLVDYVSHSDDQALVLDSFGGSGTTGHAVLDLNKRDFGKRRFILVEMDEKIASTITSERLRRVIEGYDRSGNAGEPIEGLGGGFRYCTLGTPLFNEFGDIDAAVTFPDLAAHIFFSETGVPIPKKVSQASAFIGIHRDKAVYLLFSPSEQGFPREASGNVLTPDALEGLPLPPADFEGERVVFAEGCTVTSERLKAEGITFKQIPYQIEAT